MPPKIKSPLSHISAFPPITAIAESHGGGSGPGTGWGKKDDEDELAFKRRCMLMAMHMMRPQNKVKKSRWHR